MDALKQALADILRPIVMEAVREAMADVKVNPPKRYYTVEEVMAHLKLVELRSTEGLLAER